MEREKLKKLDHETAVKLDNCVETEHVLEVLYHALMELEMYDTARVVDAQLTEWHI